jgi:hypothetical protein
VILSGSGKLVLLQSCICILIRLSCVASTPYSLFVLSYTSIQKHYSN